MIFIFLPPFFPPQFQLLLLLWKHKLTIYRLIPFLVDIINRTLLTNLDELSFLVVLALPNAVKSKVYWLKIWLEINQNNLCLLPQEKKNDKDQYFTNFWKSQPQQRISQKIKCLSERGALPVIWDIVWLPSMTQTSLLRLHDLENLYPSYESSGD